jgi:thioredoxin-dependent peroxiredoxin
MKINVGEKAPMFTGLNQNGQTTSLESFRGKKLILFFYPQDNTPTCTVEACNLRDHYMELKSAGYELLGVSADSQKKHQNFIKKFNLPFDLIADTEREIINAFGVWGEKKTFGKTYDGIHRTTYVIGESGKIINRIDGVKSKNHAQQILDGQIEY